MGGTQSYPGLTEDVLEDYTTLTYLSKGEILHVAVKHGLVTRAIFTRKLLASSVCGGLASAEDSVRALDTKLCDLMKKFHSINPEKLEIDCNHRFTKEEIIKKFDVLKNNPFRDRIFRVFSSKQDNCFSFEDLLDLCSAMSSDCSVEVKAAWAFRVFDLDEDNQISARDIKEIIDRLTWDPDNRRNYIDRDSKAKIADVILEEMKLDYSGSIGMSEFKIIMSRLPEFESSFYFRL